jgi:hypothetical protein
VEARINLDYKTAAKTKTVRDAMKATGGVVDRLHLVTIAARKKAPTVYRKTRRTTPWSYWMAQTLES